ncbi:MAG: type II toxin-antitoxin system VapB family antitoxin [Kiloniellaceae bacterium]
MALNVKDPEADRLARELAARTGETITETVVKTLRERLKRETAKTPVSLKDEILAISRRAGRLPRQTGKVPEAIIGYDDRDLPLSSVP